MLFPLLLIGAALAACGPDADGELGGTLFIGGIPDQDTALLVRRFDGVADYLSQELGVDVEYASSIDYSAVVTAFEHGDIHLAWFGGLTGVQARRAVSGAQAIAQRPRDAEFLSVFIVQSDIPAQGLRDLKGLTFTFGSESSSSGHLMPRHFLLQAGVDSERDFDGLPSFSGSHDRTWKLVESGAYQAGALNEAVWARALEEGKVDLSRVRVLEVTPPYYGYSWTLRPNLDESFGPGFSDEVREALLGMGRDPGQRKILEAFSTDSFVETSNDNYKAIEEIARHLGMVE